MLFCSSISIHSQFNARDSLCWLPFHFEPFRCWMVFAIELFPKRETNAQTTETIRARWMGEGIDQLCERYELWQSSCVQCIRMFCIDNKTNAISIRTMMMMTMWNTLNVILLSDVEDSLRVCAHHIHFVHVHLDESNYKQISALKVNISLFLSLCAYWNHEHIDIK